jgi:hypothetical protein
MYSGTQIVYAVANKICVRKCTHMHTSRFDNQMLCTIEEHALDFAKGNYLPQPLVCIPVEWVDVEKTTQWNNSTEEQRRDLVRDWGDVDVRLYVKDPLCKFGIRQLSHLKAI